ncbi:MAG: aspartate--tRNA(Asn) ligase [bacterium]
MEFKDLKNNLNKEVTLQAYVENIRDLQYVQFVILRNNGIKLQMTIEKEGNDKLVDLVSNLTLESTIKITGMLMDSPKVKLNGMELIPTEIEITSNSLSELPIDFKVSDNSLRETRLDYRFLDLRSERNNLFFKAQTTILNAMRNYWYENDFVEINTPKICEQAAESGAEVFKLDYFGQKACLSQSPQFYKQMAIAGGFNKVFEIAPAFRAENSHTSYHAAEIQMIDAEIGFIDSVEDVMQMEEKWIKYFMNELILKHGEEIENVFKIKLEEVKTDFPRITLEEVKKIVFEKYKYKSEKTDDLDRKEEEYICKYCKKEYNSDFVYITKWPFSARPFYHMKDEDGYSCSYDLLYKGLEITTGAQRENRYEILKNQIIEKEIDPKELEFYLDFFKYGCPPHGGFGFGLSRLMMQILEIDNIREATFVYRGPNRIKP